MSLIKCNLNGNEIKYNSAEFEILKNINNIKYLHYIGNGVNVINPKGNTSCYRMFENFEGTSLDLSNFNTSRITNMNGMFFNCNNLKYLNLEKFDTSKVENMRNMFCLCKSLKELNLSSFNTSNVINMECMFGDCIKLKELDLSNFNTYNTKYMLGMFAGCEELELLNISNFNTSNVSKIDCMFWDCKKIKELDISSFNIYDTKNISEFRSTFCGCENLEKVKVNSNSSRFFSNHKNTLFEDCKNITLIVISELDKVIQELFYYFF